MWDVETGKEVKKFEGHSGRLRHSGRLTAITVSSDGKYLFTGSDDRTARMWDVETGKQLKTFEGLQKKVTGFIYLLRINAITVSPDGKYLFTCSNDKTARMRDVQTGKEVKKFEGHSSHINAIVVSSDGKYLFTGSDDATACMWDVQTGKEFKKFGGPFRDINAITVSSDGKYLFTGSDDRTASMWDVETGEELKKFEGHSSNTVCAITVSSDGKYLFTTKHMWDVETGLQLKELPPSASFKEEAILPVRKKDTIHIEIDNNGVGFTEDDTTTRDLSLYKGTYFGIRRDDFICWTTKY